MLLYNEQLPAIKLKFQLYVHVNKIDITIHIEFSISQIFNLNEKFYLEKKNLICPHHLFRDNRLADLKIGLRNKSSCF